MMIHVVIEHRDCTELSSFYLLLINSEQISFLLEGNAHCKLQRDTTIWILQIQIHIYMKYVHIYGVVVVHTQNSYKLFSPSL